MYTWLWLVPLVSAVSGMIIAQVVGKMLLNRIPGLLQSLARSAGSELFPLNDIRSKISDKNNLQNIMPLIDEHIDEFLRYKMSKAMPMIGMFIGDKTISQLKSIFLQELEDLFPVVMDKYMENLSHDQYLQALMSQKISAVPPERWKAVIKTTMKKQLAQIPVAGFLAGLIIGLVQVLVLYFLS